MRAQQSPPFSSFLLKRSESSLNRWIAQSSAALDECSALEGRSMIIDIDNIGWSVRLAVTQQQVRLSEADSAGIADVVVRAGMFDLVALLRVQTLAQMRAGEVEFRGSPRVAECFSRLIKLARPCLEDELAGWIGGMPAHALAQSSRAAFAWSARTADAIELDAVEYLQAEVHELPRPQQVANYLRAVERLRDDTDRLAQRIARLGRVASLEPPR